jgi:hypothetical protein
MRSASIPSIAALAASLVAILLAVVALADSGGGGDTDELERRIGDVQSSLADIETATSNAQLIGALNTLSATPFHDIDEQLQAATEIPAGISGDVTTARQVASAITWPSELQEDSSTLVSHLEALEAALESDDLEAAKTEAAASHEAWHDFSGTAYAHVAGEEPPAHEEDEASGDQAGGESEEHAE